MRSRRHALATLFALALGVTSTLRAEEPKIEGDLKALQGEWVSKDEMGGESTWKFKGDTLSLKTPTREYIIKVKLDEKAKPFASIEFEATQDSPDAKGAKLPGIYKIEGEKAAKICFAGDSTRPTEFKTEIGSSFSFDLKKK